MNLDHVQVGGDRIGFVASEDLINAIDAASAHLGVTRSHYIRARIAEYLRAEGYFPPGTASCKYEARFRTPAK